MGVSHRTWSAGCPLAPSAQCRVEPLRRLARRAPRIRKCRMGLLLVTGEDRCGCCSARASATRTMKSCSQIYAHTNATVAARCVGDNWRPESISPRSTDPRSDSAPTPAPWPPASPRRASRRSAGEPRAPFAPVAHATRRGTSVASAALNACHAPSSFPRSGAPADPSPIQNGR